MGRSDFRRSALGVGLAVVLLAGCGGERNGALPQSQSAIVNHRVHRAPGSSGDLLYVSTNKKIAMLSYPDGKLIATIRWYAPNLTYSICSDPNTGNVFIPEGSTIYQYAHGATTPTATLTVPDGDTDARGCAVDPTTGDLALVANDTSHGGRGAFLVYAGAQGTPVTYSDKKIEDLIYAAYDDSGDLFSMDACCHASIRIAELKDGKTDLNFLKLENCSGCSYSKMQWDGKYLSFPDFGGSQTSIGQLSLSRTTATLVNSVILNDMANRDGGSFWIHNGIVFAEYQKLRKHNDQGVGAWSYPSGGDAAAKFYGITKGPKEYIYDLTVSVAPSGSHRK